MHTPTYILNRSRLEQAIRASPYRSVQGLARALGIHRNTIYFYLRGGSAISPALSKILDSLKLSPSDLLERPQPTPSLPNEEIAPLVDALHALHPDAAFVLFGSRAKGSAHRYSDYDLGVYSSTGFSESTYRKLLRRKEEFEERLPVFIDLVNLNRADPVFLNVVARTGVFLGGKLTHWFDLQKRRAAA